MNEPVPVIAEVVPISSPSSPVPPATAIPAPIEISIEKVASNKALYWTLGLITVAGIVAFIVYKKRTGKVPVIETPAK